MAGKSCCGGGSGGSAACIQADSATVLDVDGAGCIGFTAAPTGPVRPGPTGLDVCISATAENALKKDANGCLEVLAGDGLVIGPGGEIDVQPDPAGPVRVTPTGLDVCVSPNVGNALTKDANGCLFAASGPGGGLTAVDTDDTSSINFEGDGTPGNPITAVVIPDPAGPVRVGPNGVDICISGDAENVLAKDANGCLKVTAGDGLSVGPGGELDLCLSADAGNAAVLGTDNCLYVPAGGGTPGTIIPETVIIPDGGSFDPTAYPGLQYVRVRVQGDGGGGSGTIAASNGDGGAVLPFASIAAGGLGGGYAESILTAAELGASPIPVTVGPGGTGGPVGGGPAGAGSGSSFGSLVTAEGGPGALGSRSSNVYGAIGPALATPAGGVGDLVIPGGMSTPGFFAIGDESGSPGVPTVVGIGSLGGSAHLSNGSGAAPWGSRGVNDGTFNTITPPPGLNYGGGGAGALSLPNAAPDVARPGGAGAPGIVIVEIFRMI